MDAIKGTMTEIYNDLSKNTAGSTIAEVRDDTFILYLLRVFCGLLWDGVVRKLLQDHPAPRPSPGAPAPVARPAGPMGLVGEGVSSLSQKADAAETCPSYVSSPLLIKQPKPEPELLTHC